MLKQIDHIGIAVESLEDSIELYKSLGLQFENIETVEEQKVRVAFFRIGEVSIELLEATSPESPIAKFIANKGPGVHHISYRTDEIDADLAKAKAEGIALIDETPKTGAHGSRIAFLHPKSTGKVLTELCQRSDDH
jgi:methylmalonyl-CoA/ethylmalonyl-CoA epimerase